MIQKINLPLIKKRLLPMKIGEKNIRNIIVNIFTIILLIINYYLKYLQSIFNMVLLAYSIPNQIPIRISQQNISTKTFFVTQ